METVSFKNTSFFPGFWQLAQRRSFFTLHKPNYHSCLLMLICRDHQLGSKRIPLVYSLSCSLSNYLSPSLRRLVNTPHSNINSLALLSPCYNYPSKSHWSAVLMELKRLYLLVGLLQYILRLPLEEACYAGLGHRSFSLEQCE